MVTSNTLWYPQDPALHTHAQASHPSHPVAGGTCASGASARGIAVQAKPRLQRGPSAMAPVRREKRLTTCLRAQARAAPQLPPLLDAFKTFKTLKA